MERMSSLNPEVTFYIRTAKKLGFIEKSKKSVVGSKQLKQMVEKKTKIPVQSQILYYNGEEIKQNKTIKIVEKSIVHVIDSRNVGGSRMKLSVKRLPQTSQAEDFQVDSNTSIEEFIKRELEPFYEEPAEKLFFVYSGRQLKRQKSFSQQHVESDTQIVCVHADKDRKNKQKTVSNRSSAYSFRTKDTIEAKAEKTQKKQLKPEQENLLNSEKKVQTNAIGSNYTQGSIQTKTQEQKPQKKCLEVQINESSVTELKGTLDEQKKTEKKVIKSIEEIQCDQIESDQDSDNEANPQQESVYPQKLPEEYLMEQTRPTSNKKSDHQNNSGTSSISEANFKKKKKVSEVGFTKDSVEKRQEQTSPRSLSLNKSPSDHEPQIFKTCQAQQRPQTEKSLAQNEQSNKEQQCRYKTRDEIFENNTHTYSSVIDEPEESFKVTNLQSSNLNPINEREDIFNSYFNRQQNQIYDSQMNYDQSETAKMEVRGFMNFSSASFLETSQMQTHQIPSYQNQELSFRQTGYFPQMINQDLPSRINNRAPQFLAHQNQSNYRRQCSQQMGDSLSFSKEQSQFKSPQESEDNLFVEYRRGPQQTQRNHNIMVREDEASESNLLSDTYHHQNATEMMNSLTFNLEPNPDEIANYSRQSLVHIVDEDEIQDQNHQVYEKRDSEVETNIRDSANPSQICSNTSSQINPKPLEGQMSLEPMSLIDGLASKFDYQIYVNSIQSEDSLDESTNHPKRNYVDPESDISCDPFHNQQVHEQTIQTMANNNVSQNTASKIFHEENSDVFVQFQAYTANFQSSFNAQNISKNDPSPKQSQSNLLEDNSFGINNDKPFESGLQNKNMISKNQVHSERNNNHQDGPIKIVEQDSLFQQDQHSKPEESRHIETFQSLMQNEQMERSAAFHEISQSMNNEKIEESYNLMKNFDKSEAYDVTFQNDPKPEQSRFEVNQGQSKIDEPQGSRLLHELSLLAMNQPENPQLLPGDYIYSTDKVQSPEEALDSILNKFAHCF